MARQPHSRPQSPCPWCGVVSREFTAKTCKQCQHLERPLVDSPEIDALPDGHWWNDRGVMRFEVAA